MNDDRTEHVLHEAFWDTMQHAVSDAELAVRDGRDFTYAVLKFLDESEQPGGSPSGPTVRLLANRWLDAHGRDRG